MKKIFTKLMLLAVAAAALVSCDKNFEEQTFGGELTQTVTLSAEKPAEVRTQLVEGVPYWSAGDKIGVYTVQEKEADNYAFVNDSKEATIKTSFTGQTAVANTLFVYYPYTTNGIAANGAKVDIPANQNPTAVSFDGKADIMIAKPVTLDAEGKQLNNLEFARLGAIVKIVLKDNTSTLAGQHISLLTLTAATNLTGRVYLDVVNQGIYTGEGGGLYHGQSKSVTATYTETTQYEVNGTNATYVVVYPQTLKSGSKITVEAVTEGYNISKEITLPTDIALESGKVVTLNVSLSATEIEKTETVEWVNNAYNLIPSTNYLEVGDKVVIVAKSAAKAMGLWDDGNNCPAVAVTKNADNTVLIDSSVAVLDVMAGKVAGSFAFKSSKGYLYAASSSSNHLKAESTLTNNSSWNVSIVDGTATVMAQGTNTRNWMRYNTDSSLFSCYGSGQADICIYKLVGEYTMPPVLTVNPESLSFENTASSQTVTCTIENEVDGVGVTATENVDWIETSVSGKTVTITVTENSGEARNATVTIEYEGAKSKTVAVSQKAAAGSEATPKTYTLVIDTSKFNTTSYAANNNEKTSTAKAADGTTMQVKWTSYQVMLQSGVMQWQKSKGYIYNSTDLGTINSVVVTSTAGTFTQYIGSSKQPTTNGTGGYFQVKIGSATGKSSKITITFTK